MALEDIGMLLFVDILGMTEYPGSPFTGNIINDLVMFFFIPMIFIIVVIYTLAGRLTDNHKIDLLLSIGAFLFIVFGGYFPLFAYLAGPYFIFLIIILGLVMFFFGHFGLRRGNGGSSGGGSSQIQHMPGRAMAAAIGQSNEEVINEYERLLSDVKAGQTELDRLEEESKENPALDRILAVQREAVNKGLEELRKLDHIVKQGQFGHGTETVLKNLKNRYHIRT